MYDVTPLRLTLGTIPQGHKSYIYAMNSAISVEPPLQVCLSTACDVLLSKHSYTLTPASQNNQLKKSPGIATVHCAPTSLARVMQWTLQFLTEVRSTYKWGWLNVCF